MSRLFATTAYASLKAATQAGLAATPQGSADAFAAVTRVEARTLRKYADHEFEMFAPLDVAADIDRAAGKPIIARALAQLAGCTVTPIAAAPHARAMIAIKETSEAVAAVAGLNETGAWGLSEAKAARAEIREALAALAGLDAALSARIDGGKS